MNEIKTLKDIETHITEITDTYWICVKCLLKDLNAGNNGACPRCGGSMVLKSKVLMGGEDLK